MTRYLAIGKTLFKVQLAYRFDVLFTAIGVVWRVLFAWILWGLAFERQTLIGGFTHQGMMAYYVVSAFLSSVDLSEGISGEVAARIRGGTFSKHMVIPSNPQLHFIAQSLGAGSYYGLFAILAAIFCTLAFRIQLALTRDPAIVICSVAMILMGLVFMASYHFFFGTLTFCFGDIGFFSHVQSAVLSFLTGALIPLSLLPQGIVAGIRFLPFSYVAYMPTMLLTGQADKQAGLFGLAVLALWTGIMLVISHFTYERFRRQYDGVGI